MSSGYAVRELLRARIYVHAFPEFFIFLLSQVSQGRVAKLVLQHLLYERTPEFEREKWLVSGDEMVKFCVLNRCFYIPLSTIVSGSSLFY